MSGMVSPFDASSARYTNSPKLAARQEDLRHGDLLAKNMTGSAGGYGTAAPKGL